MTRHAAMACALLIAGCAQKTAPVKSAAAPAVLLIPPPGAPAAAAARPRKPVAAVETIEHCPALADIRRLRAARPKPLRNQPMPATPAERVARTSAQLGLYEAHGAWADQVDDVLAHCDPG